MPVALQSLVTSDADTATALADIDAQLARTSTAPHFLFVFYSPVHDDAAIARFVDARFPGVPVLGGTSHRGVMSEAGLAEPTSLGMLLVDDPAGMYGAAAAPLGDEPADVAEETLHRALKNADAAGELPELVWLYQTQGREEAVLEGIRRVVGDRCPVIGASSAAESTAGGWRQLGPDGPLTDGLVVGALFPSGGVSVAYQGGYEPTGHSGVATMGDVDSAGGAGGGDGPDRGVAGGNGGRPSRHLLRIDDEPAAVVYNRWIDEALPAEVLANGGSIVIEASGSAIGLEAGMVGDVPYYRLIQPVAVSAEGGLLTGADIDPGARVYGMRGSKHGLVRRAGRVVTSAMATLDGERRGVAGGVVIYCAGCRITVDDAMGQVADAVAAGFGGRPLIGCFTGGEQGPALGCNVHANLMVSAVVFGR